MKRIFIYSVFLGVMAGMNACKTSKQPSASNKTSGGKEEKEVVQSRVVLKNGQKITATTSSSSSTELAMGMEMKNTNSATNIITVISSDEKNYTVSNTLTKFALSMSMMGQENSYDSEKPGDKDNEIGKSISSKLNVPDTVTVNRMTGSATDHKKDSPERPEKGSEENPLGGMMDMLGANNKDILLENAFFVIPADKKIGDSWTDSSSTEKIKTVKTYTLKSIDNNIATIEVKGNISGSGESEAMGQSISFTMDTKSNGNIIVDTKTSLVSKITNDSDITMTMEMMGQSMPATSKFNSTITYKY